MSFNFIDDSRWKDLDEGTKQKMLDVSFKEDVASDNRWQTLDENTQRAMRDTYFNEARLHEEYVTAPEERGWARASLSHAARGTVSAIGSTGEVLELVDLTPREIDTNAGFLDEFGRGIVDWSEKSIKEKPYLRPSKAKLRGDVGFVKRGVMGGVESMPLSASVVVGALGGALATSWIPIPGARIVGGAVGGLTALIAQFGVGQYGKEYKSAYEELGRTRPNISEEEKKEISHRSAFGSASFEVGTELPEHLFALYTFGGSKVLTAPIKATLKNMLRKPVKTLLKGVGKQAPMSVSSEMVAGGGQAWTRQREGLLGPTIGEGVKESIIPAITMSLFFGAGAAGFNRAQSRSFMKQLNSPNTNTRLNAADLMAKRIAGNTKDESLANVWRQSAQDTISKGEAFNLNESIVDFASIKMAEDIEQDQEIVRREAVGDIFKATTTDEAVEAFDMAVTTDISELERMVAGEPTEIAPTKTEAIREVALEKEKPLEITKTEPQISEHLKDIRDNLDNAFIELDEGNQEPLDQIIQDASGDIELEAVRRGLDNRGINPDRYLPKTPYSPAKNKTLSVEEMEGAVRVEPARTQSVAPEKAKLVAKKTVNLDKMKYREGGDAIGQEYHGYITAYDIEGKKIGTVDYSYFNGKTAVKMIKVEPGYQRQGVATRLLEKLQEDSETPIEMQGTFATKEGQALFEKFKAAKPQPSKEVIKGRVIKEVAPKKEPVRFIRMQHIKGMPSEPLIEAMTGELKGGQIDYDADKHEIINKAEYEKAIREVALPTKPEVKMPPAKEPWEMTLEEWKKTPLEEINSSSVEFDELSTEVQKKAKEQYIKNTGDISGADKKSGEYNLDLYYFDKETGRVVGDDILSHLEEIKLAISKGKPVPPEVLADYPDLAPAKPQPITPAKPKPSEALTEAIEGEGIPKSTRIYHQSDTGELKQGEDVYGLGKGYFVSKKKLPKDFYGKKDIILELKSGTKLFDFQEWVKEKKINLRVPEAQRKPIFQEAYNTAKQQGYDGVEFLPDDIWIFSKDSISGEGIPKPTLKEEAKIEGVKTFKEKPLREIIGEFVDKKIDEFNKIADTLKAEKRYEELKENNRKSSAILKMDRLRTFTDEGINSPEGLAKLPKWIQAEFQDYKDKLLKETKVEVAEKLEVKELPKKRKIGDITRQGIEGEQTGLFINNLVETNATRFTGASINASIINPIGTEDYVLSVSKRIKATSGKLTDFYLTPELEEFKKRSRYEFDRLIEGKLTFTSEKAAIDCLKGLFPSAKEKLESIKTEVKREVAEKPKAKVEIATTPEGKEISVDLTKKEESALTPKQQKKYLMAEIDKAIEEAPEVEPVESLVKEFKAKVKRLSPKATEALLSEQAEEGARRIEKYGTVTIHVPDDGVFTILNTKQAIEDFKKKAKTFPSALSKAKVTIPGAIRKAPLKESIGELIKTPGGKEYFTDGSLIIKGKPPLIAKYGEKTTSQESIKALLVNETEPAELKYYAFSNPDVGEGVAGTPIPDVLTSKEYKSVVVFQSKSGELYEYNQFKFNAITKRFPKVKYGIVSKDWSKGLLIAYDNKKPVAALMPFRTEGGVVTAESMAVRLGFLKAKTAEKPAGEINKDTIILKAKDTPRKTSDIPGVYLSADKKYAGAYANGEVDAAHQRGTLTPKNGAIIEVKIDAEESIGFGDIMQSLEKDDLYDLLIESGATEETAKKLSTNPKEATDYIDVVSGTNWMQKEMGYDEVFRDNIKWGDIVKIEIFKNSKLNRTIKGDAKVMPDEITFYTGTPYTEHLEILVTKPAEKEFAAKTIKPDEERIYYAGTEKGKLVGKYTYLTTNPEYAKNFGTDIRQFTALPEKTLDLTSQAEKAISFEGFQKILKKDNITITEEMREKYDDVEKPIWMWIRKYPDIAEVIKSAGYDSIKQVETFTGKGKGETTLMILDKSKVTEIPITYRAPTEIGAPKYATKQSISDSDITISQVRDIFKPQHAGLTQDGNIWVKLRAGYGFQVKNVQSITENELAFEIGRGRMKLNGEFIAGKFEDDTIEITKGIGDIWTLTHESEHLAEKAGLITPLEIGVLKSKIRQLTKQGKFETQNKDDIGGQEDRAKFIEAELHNRASYTGITQRILQKIADFIDSMVNLFHTTSRGVVRGFESGEIFQREVAGREVQTISPAYALAGKKAIGAPTGQLAKAQEMLAEGKSEKEVWKETGWLKGAEGKDKPLKDVWKWEIDDSGAKFNSQKLKNIDKGKGLLTTDTLSQLLSHEELYKNYPQLRNVLTTIEVDFDAKRNTGSFTPAIDRSTEGLVDLEAEIKIKAKSIQDVKETLLHEIQHVIQREESFVKGGSPALQAQSVYFDVLIKLQSEIDELKSKEWKETNPDKRYNIRFELKEKQELYQELRAHPDIAGERIGLGKKAYQQYRKLAGEIESRDTAARAKLTAEERRMKMPYESQGIPREEWIITEGEGTSFSVEPARSIKKPLSIDAINEMYADAIEVADRAKNRELARKLQRELEFIGGTITLPSEIRKLRGNIRAWANYKGLTKKKLREIVKKVTGHLSTTHKKTTVAQLKEVLKQVARTRPRIVDKKTVVTKKTEGRIQTLKTNLTNDKQMTEAVFQGLLQTMRIKEPRYISKHRFITETQGKEVINRMLKIAPVVKVELGIKEERKTVPGAKAVADKIESKYKREDKAMKNIRTYSLLDMHHFADAMEKLTGVPFGKFREVISRKRHEIEYEIDKEIGKVSEGESFKEIAQDEAAVQRINDYVASKLPQYYKGVPEYPKDITENEKKIANEIIAGLKRKEGAVRYNRFFLWREKGIVIPNAPDVELMKATEILETQGDAEIRKWLEGRSWGVVKSGYGAEEVLGAKVMVAKHKPGFGLRGLMSRVTTKYQKQERDILKRYASYIRSITYRTELRPLIDGWVELFENNKEKFAEPRKVANLLTRNIKETLGEKNDMTALEEYMIRLYSQAARTIFLDIRKGVRNLFQNIAFTTDPTDLLKGKKLSKEDRKYFDIYLDQSRGIQRDWLYQEYEGIPGFSTLNKIADYINVMGRTDRANRLWAYTTRLVKVRRSIENHPNYKTDEKEMIAMMAESKWGDVEQAERVHAIDKLATEGEDAMVREIAGSFVKKVHFLYGRSERSPAEQGSELTRILSNLFTFRKGYVQRIVLDVRKLRSGQKEVESLVSGRKQALKSLSGVMIMGAFASWIYTTLTGDEREPYRPDKIIGDLSLGGLATGMQEQVGDLTRDMMSAATGDSAALGRVINGIARANDSFIPFYNEVLHAIEGLTGYRNVDKAVLRQIRSALDDRYKAKSMGFYKQGRTALERAQHIVFGTESESMREKFRKEYKERKDNRESLIPLRKKFNEYNRGKEEKISWTSITK